VPFYRVNALSSDGFIGEGSNGTRKRGRISVSTFCFFTQGRESPPLRSHGGVENSGTSGWVAKGHPRPFGDPGRPISRYGYDYEKYGNSTLKDVK